MEPEIRKTLNAWMAKIRVSSFTFHSYNPLGTSCDLCDESFFIWFLIKQRFVSEILTFSFLLFHSSFKMLCLFLWMYPILTNTIQIPAFGDCSMNKYCPILQLLSARFGVWHYLWHVFNACTMPCKSMSSLLHLINCEEFIRKEEEKRTYFCSMLFLLYSVLCASPLMLQTFHWPVSETCRAVWVQLIVGLEGSLVRTEFSFFSCTRFLTHFRDENLKSRP